MTDLRLFGVSGAGLRLNDLEGVFAIGGEQVAHLTGDICLHTHVHVRVRIGSHSCIVFVKVCVGVFIAQMHLVEW